MKKRSTQAQAEGQVLMDHIRELRTRLIVCATVLILGGVIGYIFYTPILEWLRSPLGTSLYYSTPAGSFNFIVKVSSMVGILAAIPFVIFQLIMFIQPVFKEKLSMKRITFYTVASIFLAVAGGAFAFYGILPGALKFFSGFQVTGLSALIDANNYLNFVINAIVTFVIVFQIPLLMVIIDRIKPISPKKLLAAEKYVVLAGLLVSLVVPFAMDITTCILIASPIIILYNISVLMIIVRHFSLRRKHVELPVIQAQHVVSAPVPVFTQVEAKTEAVAVIPAEPTHIQTVMHRSANLPTHLKPLPGTVNVEQLRAEAKARREQQIAQRVALYNQATTFPSVGRAINDIR